MSTLTLNITLPPTSGLLQPGGENGFSDLNNTGSSSANSPLDSQTIEQLAQLLGELLKPLQGGQAGEGSGLQNEGGLGTGSGIGASYGLGSGSSLGLGTGGGVSGTDSGSAASPQDTSSSALSDLGSSGLDQALSPDGSGGGQITGNQLLKALLELIAQMMDKQQDQFGQPQSDSGSGSSAGNPVSAPSTTSAGSSAGEGGSAAGGGMPAAGGSGTAAGGGVPAAGGGGTTAGGGVPSSAAGGTTPVTDLPDPAGSAGTGAGQQVGFPTASGNPTVIHDTIVVKAGEVFDGKGQTFTGGSELGDGGQSESQKPLFKLEDGASLKNVTIGNNGADGIHLYGDAKIDNVHFTDVGENAITVKPNESGKKSNVEITNSSFANASDKILQLNADTSLTVDNVKAKDFGTFVRTNGGQQGDWDLNLKNISAENGKFSFVKSDSEGLNINTSNISLDNVNNHYKVPESASLKVAGQ